MADLDKQINQYVDVTESVTIQVENPFGDVYDNVGASDAVIIKIPGTVWAFGEESPTENETPVPWTAWADANGTACTYGQWDRLEHEIGQIWVSDVYQVSGELFDLLLSKNVYQVGFGSVEVFFRHSMTYFEKTAGIGPGEGPAWRHYLTGDAPYRVRCAYIQFRTIGGTVV